MTTLWLTRLCAEAMDIKEVHQEGERLWHSVWRTYYDPLRDDAQAMALVKRFRLDIVFEGDTHTGNVDDPRKIFVSATQDLNRAIVECVAKMRVDSAVPEA